MKPETNKEIDLLLRRMAREDGAARGGAVQSDDRHLDADELSSYAQNALPPAAHVRYMAHLADCATCRRLVTELSLSLGSAAAPAETVPASSGWKAFLASLLSPMVLRYAVPALGVIIVAVVGFVVMRRQAQHDSFAKLQEARPVSSATAPPEQEPYAGLVNSMPRAGNKVEGQNAKSDTRGNPANVAESRVAGAAGAAPATSPKEEKSGAQTQPSVAGAAPATANAAPPQPEAQAETVTVAKKQPETEKEKAVVQSANEERDRVAAAKPSDSAMQTTAPKPSSTGGYSALRGLSARRAETARPAAAAKTGAADKDAGNSNADDETRTIAGRRFRKQDNAWIDTAYESSTATVNMARNSEQFRALVADEPAIGTIAKQLDGEVIVVWKGHAYRIR